MKRIIFFSAMLFMLHHFTSEAQTNARQSFQQARIAEGRASGELTRNEARALKAEQRHIRRVERRAKADGEVTPDERERLNNMQNRANRHIRRQKNDLQEKGDN